MLPEIRSNPMKQESENQGWNAEQKRCPKPACRLHRGCRIHAESVADLKTQTRKKLATLPPEKWGAPSQDVGRFPARACQVRAGI